ncbi:MAG TPA: NTP transferase domain-containing protein [Candidatus Angelobacter sp.]
MERKRQNSGVAALVLAAGMSRRMKPGPGKPTPASPGAGPKQLLRLDGKPLLQHTLENVRRARVDEIVLVLGFAADAVRRQVPTDGIRVVINPEYEQGMGTSLRAGLPELSAGVRAAFVVLADQPFVRPETLDRMIAVHRETKAEITLPLYRGFRGNPVLLDCRVFPELMGLSGDVGCRAIFGSHTQGIHKVDVNDPGILLDIDSLEDFERLQRPGLSAEIASLPDLESREAIAAGRPELVIVGHDAVAQALGHLGPMLGFCTTYVDPLLTLKDLPQADRVLHVLDFSRLPKGELYVVVASRGQCDEEAVEQALLSNAAYIGLLANRKRAEEVMNALRNRGVAEAKLGQVRVPAGVAIHAETPEEIALSIMAEIVAVRRSKTSKAKGGQDQR